MALCFVSIFILYTLYISHTMGDDFNEKKCDDWYKKDIQKYGSDAAAHKWANKELEACPPKWNPKLPKGWYLDGSCSKGDCYYHPGAHDCMRTWAGQQCCYLKNGKRCDHPECGGSVDRVAVASKWQIPFNIWGHASNDLHPFEYCCNVKSVWSDRSITSEQDNVCGSCEKYFKRRPIYGPGETWKICGRNGLISENNFKFESQLSKLKKTIKKHWNNGVRVLKEKVKKGWNVIKKGWKHVFGADMSYENDMYQEYESYEESEQQSSVVSMQGMDDFDEWLVVMVMIILALLVFSGCIGCFCGVFWFYVAQNERYFYDGFGLEKLSWIWRWNEVGVRNFEMEENN
eukprot:179460_1